MIDLMGYIADAAIIASYFVLVRTGRQMQFNWVNALCGPPILLTEYAVGARVAMVITAFFMTIGAYGVLKGSHA